MTARPAPLSSHPSPADFAPPPDAATRARWLDADRAARPARLERLRSRLAAEGLDAYFGVRIENSRYITGFRSDDAEEVPAGGSGSFLLSGESLSILADSRYTIQAARDCPDARVVPMAGSLASRWEELTSGVGARRVGVEAALVSHETWGKLAAAAPGVELVPVSGWIERERASKDPAEFERIAAACAVADRALATVLPEIRPGATEREIALRLEWEMRTNGAEMLAFDVICLSGPEAALPHGVPADRPIAAGAVLLIDFGARVEGYRSDMTRTLFVGEPTARDLEVYELVHRAQGTALDWIETRVRAGEPLPDGRTLDALSRDVIEAAGHGDHFGHGLGHGIGIETHELPSLGRRASDEPLPERTAFTVEPGVYLEGETGVRIEDTLAVDVAARRCERLTRFPRDVVVVGR